MRRLLLGTMLLLTLPPGAGGQASASLSGRVVVESTEAPVVGAEISIEGQATASAAVHRGVAAPALRAQPVASCLSSLHGQWRGPGTVLGRAITMEQEWSSAVGGAFTSLTMRHLSADGGAAPSFQGLGVYRARGDSVTGTWHDSRGIIFSVAGRCADGVFSSLWSGVERGRTVYARRGDSLMVIDSVFPPTGAAREFGRSVMGRHAAGGAGSSPGVGAVRRR